MLWYNFRGQKKINISRKKNKYQFKRKLIYKFVK